jgi:hypothetical protein
MAQIRRITNIQQMAALDAKQQIIAPIRMQAYQKAVLDPQAEQNLADVADHPDDSVVQLALEVIEAVRDKAPFVPVLQKHATNHSKPACAVAAYEAMSGAKDLRLFYQLLEQGVQSGVNPAIASAALSSVLVDVTRTRTPDAQLQQILIIATEHPDDSVVSVALSVLAVVKDKKPFFPALQKCLNQRNHWPVGYKAAHLLGSISGVAPSEIKAPIVCEVPVNVRSVKNVRLDFNIEANGMRPGLEKREVIQMLSKLFDQSVKDGIVTAKTKVFYAPSDTLAENRVIEVQFPESDKDDILSRSFQGFAPEFDLDAGGGGVYTATLKKGPTF